MIVDAHIHLWNPLHGKDTGVDREALRWGRARQGTREYYAAPPSFEDSQSTYERALAHMDWLGIDRAVVLQETMDGNQDAYLTQVRRVCPERFSCMALFDGSYYGDPLGGYRRAVEENKLQGLLVKTPQPYEEIGVPALMPLWQACADRGLPIVLKDGAPDDVRRLVAAVPGLKIVLSHFGGCSGPREEHEERLRIAADSEHVYLDSGALTYRQKYPFVEAQERLQQAVETVGAGKIVWGSDYPRPQLVADNSYKQQLAFITHECGFLTEAQRDQILGGTASSVYCWGE